VNDVKVIGGDESLLDQSQLTYGGSALITHETFASGLFLPGLPNVNRVDLLPILESTGVGIQVSIRQNGNTNDLGASEIDYINLIDGGSNSFYFDPKIPVTSGGSYWVFAKCSSTGSHYLHSSGNSLTPVFSEYRGKPILRSAENTTSKELYGYQGGPPIIDRRITDAGIAQTKANSIIDANKDPRFAGNVTVVGDNRLKAGDLIDVSIPQDGVDANLEIVDCRHVFSAGGYTTVLSLDSEEYDSAFTFKDHEDRLRRLEQELVNTDLQIFKTFGFSDGIEVRDDGVVRYYLEIGTGMIWGHPTPANGEWGTAEWGPGTRGDWVLI
jgi:hypothetical protein